MDTITRRATLAAMGVTWATLPEGPIPEINDAENSILGVAFSSYLVLEVTNNPIYRYLDWAITTPLLVYTYWKLAEQLGWEGQYNTLGTSAILMSVLGYLSQINKDITMKNALFMVSSLFFIILIVEVIRINSYLQNVVPVENKGLLGVLPWFFIIGWGLYPVVFYASPVFRNTIWNILDLINKPVYTLVFNDVIKGIPLNQNN